VQNAGATDDNLICIFLESATAGNRVQGLLPGPVVPMLVGTGGVTRGKKVVTVSDGVADAPAHDSSGATDGIITGIAYESGVAGDMVGVIPTFFNRGSA
jgi:hypothetical protein